MFWIGVGVGIVLVVAVWVSVGSLMYVASRADDKADEQLRCECEGQVGVQGD